MAYRQGKENRKWKNPGRKKDKAFLDRWRFPVRIGSFFLDSGAHSLYNVHVLDKGMGGVRKTHSQKEIYAWYETQEFWDYVDEYAWYVKRHANGIDLYANCDVIFNPEKSWEVQKYLEQEHGLNPVPVIHYLTPVEWVDRYIDAGYTYVGVGGLGQEITRHSYLQWADQVFDRVCDSKDRMPRVKIHGFAVASYKLLIRYPWYSVDSTSWAKMAGYGGVFVPHRRNGKFIFTEEPYFVATDPKANTLFKKNKHYLCMGAERRQLVHDWLKEIDVPVGRSEGGKVVEHGVTNHYGMKAVANLRFYERMCNALPAWPWPFAAPRKRKGLFR